MNEEVNKELKMMHSSSCCFYKGELYVSFYAGTQECVDQKVFIVKKEKDGFSLVNKLSQGTGNPVLFVLNDDLYCCYSVFTRPMINNVFDLWRTTYTSVEKISGKNKNKYLLSTYCCPRCNPYYLDSNNILLPCYDEDLKTGIIFHFHKNSFLERYIYKRNQIPLIQPTIVQKNDKFYVLYRNFLKSLKFYPSKCFAPFNELIYSPAQHKIIYGDTKYSSIPNFNESLYAFNDKEKNAFVIHNAKQDRKELTLGFLDIDKNNNLCSDPLLVLNEEEKGSYPNACYNDKGQLIISFTSYDESTNKGSKICIATVSTDCKKILSRKYIDSSIFKDIKE